MDIQLSRFSRVNSCGAFMYPAPCQNCSVGASVVTACRCCLDFASNWSTTMKSDRVCSLSETSLILILYVFVSKECRGATDSFSYTQIHIATGEKILSLRRPLRTSVIPP